MQQLIKILTVVMVVSAFVSCKPKNVLDWSDSQVRAWFDASEWSAGLPMKPDSSINLRLLAEQNIKNPDVWRVAYRFLNENDLKTMDLGRYELDSVGTYATVSEYQTKDPDVADFEAHRKYIDIQYVPSGQEYIELTSLENIDVMKQEYSEEKDIEFFSKGDGVLRLADKDHFFVFFPSDGHKPCLKVDTSATVRKIVVKVPVEL